LRQEEDETDGMASEPAPPGDAELLQGLRQGSAEAFGALYRRYQGAIYRFALHLTGSTSAAEDVTQEVFAALIRGREQIDAERGTVSMWLHGVARHQARRWMMRERRHASVGLDESAVRAQPADADPLGDLDREERIETIRRALNGLPIAYREAVVLCDLQELSYADAASVLGCAVGTVRSRLHRGRALLARALGAPKRETGGKKGRGCLT
jgi:RNA polymerase sigma-70 factor (ECF subfamily)